MVKPDDADQQCADPMALLPLHTLKEASELV